MTERVGQAASLPRVWGSAAPCEATSITAWQAAPHGLVRSSDPNNPDTHLVSDTPLTDWAMLW